MIPLNNLLFVPNTLVKITGTMINHGRHGDHDIELDKAVSRRLVSAIDKVFEDFKRNRRPKPSTITMTKYSFSVTGSRRNDGQTHVAVFYIGSNREDLSVVSGVFLLLKEVYAAAGYIVEIGSLQVGGIIVLPAAKA